ncbi:MAG: response regulator transcription factor [Chloroflexi bacterium]|nr:response regulator transcription factor [Chloroflexota bacterium]
MTKIRVLLVDDHAIVREGLLMLLAAQPDIEVIGEAADGSEAIDLAARLQPDIVLMDLDMPRVDGLEATLRIKREHPHIHVLALTVHDSDDYFFQVLAAGASGYVLKGARSAELLAALRAVREGEVYLLPSLTKRLVKDYLKRVRSGEESRSYDCLTEREQQVLRLIASGRTNHEIAVALTITSSTVQTHCANIMEKLGLHSRAALMHHAYRRGLIAASDT